MPVSAVLGVVALATSLLSAQAKRPMALVDLLEVPRTGDPQLSHDGRQVIFTLDKPDWKQNRRVAHIWRADSNGTNLVQMTHGEKGESAPRWSPDGKRIAFVAKRGDSEDNQIYVINNQGGEARQVSRRATSVSNIAWSPDGASIYFLASDSQTPEEKERDKLKDDVFAFDENYKQQHLWKISVDGGAEQKITDGDYSIVSYRVSRAGEKIVVHRAPTPLLGDSFKSEVWIMQADGRNALQLTRNGVPETGGELSPDESQVLFVSGVNAQFEPYYNDNLFVVPARGGPARLVMPDFAYDVERASWSGEGRTVFIAANMGVHSELFEIDLPARSPRQVTDGRHAIQSWSFVPAAGRHIFLIDEPTRAGEVWTLAASAGASPQQITHTYDYLDLDFTLARQEKSSGKAPMA